MNRVRLRFLADPLIEPLVRLLGKWYNKNLNVKRQFSYVRFRKGGPYVQNNAGATGIILEKVKSYLVSD